MSVLSHLSLTMVPLMVGVMFSQTEALRKVWNREPRRTNKAQVGVGAFHDSYNASLGIGSSVENQSITSG
jgi:hypothetical protein